MKISICISTYKRAGYLAKILNSIISWSLRSTLEYQVCVSDNHSTGIFEMLPQDVPTLAF